MKTTRIILSTTLILFISIAFGQKGKDGTLTQSGTSIVNEFTTLTSNASVGNATISVANSSLNTNSRFSGNLAAGDLVLIIQMQGVDMIGSPEPWTGNQTYGLPIDPTWGQITNYNNCGNNEYAEVKSVPNGTSIELRCGLSNNYTASGNVQIVRVPRFLNLTVNGTLTSEAWNGSTGGILAIEVDNNLIINGSIDASALGFRGGIANNTTSSLGVAHWSRPDLAAGGLKGESVRGWGTEYDSHGGRYCKAAPANSGGGGNANNGGGGGGGNAGNITNWIDGVGVPQGNYNAWNIETLKDEVTPAPIGGVARSGGGRGGYTFSSSNQDANTSPTGNAAWGGDNRRNRGGLGGRPLDYSTGRIYLGGAGGAADLNESTSTGGGGGNGGGIIYIMSYGSVSGNGNITSNGENGQTTTAPSAPFLGITGADGAGGAGAGGTVLINSNATISGISIITDGGNGGDQIIIDGGFGDLNEAEGPGGGGGGGYIAISSGTPTRTANGGMNGVTNSQGVTEFPMNGATAGGVGLPNETISNFYLTTTNDTICIGTTSTLTATVNGTLPAGATITWYDAEVNGNVIGTNTFTTAALSNDTIFYVGTCPGTYLIPVSVIMSPALTFNDASVVINNENCGLNDGSISGITVSGGTAPITYTWNGTASATTNLSSVAAGNYTLVATDSKGCSIIVGTYAISNISSLSLNAASIVITNENCGLGNGGITGITTSGGTGTITYDWNGTASTNENLSSAGAGSYTLTATDGVGCSTTSGPYVITNAAGPAINATNLSITDESCTSTNGSITGLTVSGGSSPYSYSWNGNSTLGMDTANLAAGNYTLLVTDAVGCTDQVGPYTVIDNASPVLDASSISVTNETCSSANGVITGITTTGGNSPFSYSWNGNSTLTADTTGIGNGTYTLTVTDALGCTDVSNPVIITNSGLTVDTTSIMIVNDVCTQGNGSITGINITSGTPTYSYSWNSSTSIGADTTSLFAGTYTLTITDGSGCVFTTTPYTIIDNVGPTINASNLSITNESCTSTNGSITGLTVSGGSSPYSYSWNGNSTLGMDTTNLAAGNYTLIVTDALGCTDQTGPHTVIDNPAPTLDITSLATTDETCGSTNGSISGITVSGGTTPYGFSWNSNATLTADTASIGGGTYTLTVTDALGCTAISSPVIITNLGLTVDTTSLILVNDACTQGSGSLTGITVSGGSPGYTYSWNGAASTTADTSSLFAGTYTLVITDAAGCIFTTNPYTIIDNTGPTIDTTSIIITDETCGNVNGSITGITSSGGMLPFTFSWNGNSTTTEDITGITSGNYTLIITDGNGCSSTMGPIVVNAISGPSIDTTSLVIVDEDCYAGNGAISGITVNGGTSPYSYSWNGSTGNLDISNISNGNYILLVTDANGCTASLGAIAINNSGAPTADFLLSGNSILLGETLTLTNNSSSDAVTYSWDFGNGTSSTDVSPSVLYDNANSFNICLVAYTATNCTDTICKTVIVTEEITSAIGIPSGFSPNGDGTNDILFVRGSGITSLTFMIYNRYGEKVFETTDITEGWDGTYRGKPENIGVFAYYIEYEYTNGEKGSLKGNVTLVK